MPQWNRASRPTCFTARPRLLDWPDAVKKCSNWIGKSTGASVRFPVYLRDASGEMKPAGNRGVRPG
jgi:leucyl-tRNA synthetase